MPLDGRAAADAFLADEPFARNGGYQRDSRITRWVFGDCQVPAYGGLPLRSLNSATDAT